MARIRTIKPEFWQDEDLSSLPPETHMLAAALLNHADDEGYFKAHPKLVHATCCPLREDSMSIQESLSRLSEVGYLELFTGTDGKSYGRIPRFSRHQTISRPTESKIKNLYPTREPSGETHGGLNEDSTPEQGTGNREQGTGKGEGASPAAPPNSAPKRSRGSSGKGNGTRLPDDFDLTGERLQVAYQHGLSTAQARTEFEKFCDYWRAQPGKAGRKADWDATWRNWVRKAVEYAARSGGGSSGGGMAGTARRVGDRLRQSEGERQGRATTDG